MKTILKNEKGFTLVEMMIVLMIISVLLMITIPNVSKHSISVNAKGCDAYIQMVQAQVQAYEIDNNKLPTNMQDLITGGYIKAEKKACGEGKHLTIDSKGLVEAVAVAS